jgi:pilus assembly protein Flp/PilA
MLCAATFHPILGKFRMLRAMDRKFLTDRRAVTALEYGIIAGVLGLVLITVFKTFGTKLSTLFTTIGNSI